METENGMMGGKKEKFMSKAMIEKIASIEELDKKHQEFMSESTERIISEKEKLQLLFSGIRSLGGSLAIPGIAVASGLGAYFTGEIYALPQLSAICTFISLIGIGPLSEGFKKGTEKLKQYFNAE